MDHVQIQFTIDGRDSADGIIDALLAERLVACGQTVGPVVSRYWWQGAVQESEEWLVLLKTRADLSVPVVDAVLARHPYETPEVVVLPVIGGAPGYLRWIEEVTVQPSRGHRGGPPARR
jgi:periplasmic divalent cation tolerance protein